MLQRTVFVRALLCPVPLSTFAQEKWKPARPWSQHSVFFLNCSLLCSENKLPVISLPLKSPAVAGMREICLCWAQSSTLQGSAAVWVLPGEAVLDGCAILWWALVQHVRKLELEQFPPHEALNYPKKKRRNLWIKWILLLASLYIILFKYICTILVQSYSMYWWGMNLFSDQWRPN